MLISCSGTHIFMNIWEVLSVIYSQWSDREKFCNLARLQFYGAEPELEPNQVLNSKLTCGGGTEIVKSYRRITSSIDTSQSAMRSYHL